MRRARRVQVLLVVGIVILAAAIYREDFADGYALLVAPATHALEVTVDGDSRVTRLAAGERRRVALHVGDHDVQLRDPDTQTVRRQFVVVEHARQELVIPTTNDQCFALLDVTVSHYGSLAGPAALPIIAQRYRRPEAFAVPRPTYLVETEMPPTQGRARALFLLQTVPCGLLDLPDLDLVTDVLGFPTGPR